MNQSAFVRISSSLCFVLFSLASLLASGQPDSVMIFDFENTKAKLANFVKPTEATYQLETQNGNTYLRVNSGFFERETGVKLMRTSETEWDLSGFYQVKADVSNLCDKAIQVELFVGNDPDGLVRWYCSDYVDLNPGEKRTITVNLAWTPWAHNPQPEVVGMRGTPGQIKTDLRAIGEFTFNTRYATSPSVFSVDNVRAVGRLELRDTTGFFPFIDLFGQYKHEEWPGKVHEISDLKLQEAQEQEDLKAHPGPKDRSQYGGWTDGPRLKATGFFRTEKYQDKWWMVDPEGYLFWTAGLNCVSSRTGTTGIQFREKCFENIPGLKQEFPDFWGEGRGSSHGFFKGKSSYETFNFLQANLQRKYGENWQERFGERIHTRFRSWGINTIGFVSDFDVALQHKTPYVGSVWISGTPKIEGSGGFWGKFHDVFDPNFRKIVRESVESQQTGANDPWCIGFFVDNELSWGQIGSLASGVLQSPKSQPAKIEFVKDLQFKYNAIDRLNNQWGTNYKSWDALAESETAPDFDKAEDDLVGFYEKIADTYFKTINEELKRVAPNQNYLGCRFAWINNDVTLKTAAKYCDIVSFNKYEFSVEQVRLPEGVDRPIMIGEFHFGATDRGMAHPGVKSVANQQERGQAYQDYIQGALRNPQIVGAHWFQFTDQPFTGRSDGENYNIGFINVCDRPYPELIEKVRETCYGMYQYRLEKD